MKSFFSGLLLVFLIIIISFIIKNKTFFTLSTQMIGYSSIAIGAILSGLLSKNIYRRTSTEKKEERFKRLEISSKFILFGIPIIISFFILSCVNLKTYSTIIPKKSCRIIPISIRI
ncbi:DUF5316 family protein [Senegalia sp. (in: firmicutes)]|uniref:DUF5316 family protein n=1 Tax=Senegalia sp. (in: firmicutes) TaxID=1924098 RepID=UPI003F955D2E